MSRLKIFSRKQAHDQITRRARLAATGSGRGAMQTSVGLKRSAVSILFAASFVSVPTFAAEPEWWTEFKRDCRARGGTISDYYNTAQAEGGCHLPNRPSNPSASTPSREQKDSAAERQRQQEETDRIARDRLAAEKREKEEKQAAFIRERDAVVLKGSSGTNTPQLKGLSGTFNHGLKGSGTEAGAQLKTVERHGRETPLQDNKAASATAQMGFDTPGTASGNLVYPDKSKYRQLPSSVLERQIPPKAMGDPQVQQILAWYRSLDAQKAETTQKIATIKEQQKQGTGDAAVLSAQLGSLTNQVRQIDTDQTKATEAVKKQVKHLGFDWVESPEPTTTEAKSK